MTGEELAEYLVSTYGIGSYPKTLNVNASTYANACQFMFDKLSSKYDLFPSNLAPYYAIPISVGLAGKGLMFKSVELILDHGSDI